MSVQLINGDCLTEMAKLPANSVDMVLTDPPYGMGFQSRRAVRGPRRRKIIGDGAVDPRWLASAARVLSDGGGLVMLCDWRTSCEWRHQIESAGLRVVSQAIWDREHHGMGDTATTFAPMHDVLWYATKGRRVWANGRPKSVLRHRRPSPTDDNGHPTCKPLGLMEELARFTGHGVVLDPFMGSGTTGVACANLGRSFIGIELDPGYFEIAQRRIANATPSMFASGEAAAV